MSFGFLILLIFGLNQGESVDQAEIRIQTINQDLARLDNKLAEMKSSSLRLSDEIGKLELQRALTSGNIEKTEIELEQVNQQISANKDRQIQLQEQAVIQKRQLRGRLRKLYKRGTLGHAQLLLEQSKLSDLINAYHYARVLTDRDHQILVTFQETIKQLDEVNRNLEQNLERATQTRATLEMQEVNLKNLVDLRNSKLAEIRRESTRNERLLTELELERDELYSMIRRLTETDVDPMSLQVPISRYKGKLSWPHEGRLLRRFGVYRDPEFGTSRRENGIRLAARPGDPVHAVYSGRVIFSDWFKSYGNLVIIDHSEKLITFYAHCEKLMVQKGDFVERGTVVATSGDTGSLEGPMLHFEIRNQTVPDDPQEWLEKRKAR